MLLIGFSSCTSFLSRFTTIEDHRYIQLENTSSYDIYVITPYYSDLPDTHYTTLCLTKAIKFLANPATIKSGETSSDPLSYGLKNSYEESFKYRGDTLFLSIVNQEHILKAHNRITGTTQLPYSKRIGKFYYYVYKYSLNDLIELNWFLSYPNGMGKMPEQYEYEYEY